MRLAYGNRTLGADLVASSNVLGYGTAMLKERSPAMRLKFTGKADEDVVADMGAAAKASAVALFGHNLTAGATVTLEGNDSDSWASPALSVSVPAGVPVVHFEERAYRYWRLRLQDPLNPSNLELGVWYLGTGLSVASVAPDAEVPVEAVSVRNVTRSGQVYGFPVYQVYAPSFELTHVTEEMRQSLLAAWAEVSNVEPLILEVWEGSPEVVPPLYVAFTMEAFRFKKGARQGLGWSSSFSCREVL